MHGLILALVLLALGVGGCGATSTVVQVSMEPAALVAPGDPRLLTTYDSAVLGIGAILTGEFGLPVPDRVTVHVYGSRQGFEEGLVRDADLSPARAAELGKFAVGVGRPRQLLFRDDVDHGREWLRLVAHELAHVCQIELAGGERGPEQWLKEGMAEWLAFGVLEHLRLDSLARRRESARGSVRGARAFATARLDLETLGSPAGFVARYHVEGATTTYQLAFLMADHLIARDGLARVVEYFRAFATSDDRGGNFERIFGQTLASFEQEVLAAIGARRFSGSLLPR